MSKIQGTLAQWRDRLRRKELSPAELVNLTADAIEADRTTNAYISFDREAALHAAAGADISSPLAGIPIAVKDNINVLGQPTRCASRLLSPYVAPYDATSIRLLKEAGGIPLGRTNMDEFAMGASGENSAYGITRNPEAPDRIPGAPPAALPPPSHPLLPLPHSVPTRAALFGSRPGTAVSWASSLPTGAFPATDW